MNSPHFHTFLLLMDAKTKEVDLAFAKLRLKVYGEQQWEDEFKRCFPYTMFTVNFDESLIWCQRNCNNMWGVFNNGYTCSNNTAAACFYFLSKDDALYFKLFWN